jgi:thiol-disulfide isomerase/thioredoxin
MLQNTQNNSQLNVFACSYFVTGIVCMALFAGCDGQEVAVPEGKPAVPEDNSFNQNTTAETLKSTGGAANATDQIPKSPPGTLELPSDYDSSPAPIESDSTESKAGGIELPPGVANPVGSASGDTNSDVKFATWQKIDNLAKSAGRITVIDLWSLACEPCLEEFPGLVKLHQAMGNSVQCIAVDVDYDGRQSRPPEYYQKRVIDFLKSVKASGFPTYICKTPSDDVFKTTKLISIPAVMIYDANGKVVKVFVDTGESNAFTYEKDVVPFVKNLAG